MSFEQTRSHSILAPFEDIFLTKTAEGEERPRVERRSRNDTRGNSNSNNCWFNLILGNFYLVIFISHESSRRRRDVVMKNSPHIFYYTVQYSDMTKVRGVFDRKEENIKKRALSGAVFFPFWEQSVFFPFWEKTDNERCLGSFKLRLSCLIKI